MFEWDVVLANAETTETVEVPFASYWSPDKEWFESRIVGEAAAATHTITESKKAGTLRKFIRISERLKPIVV